LKDELKFISSFFPILRSLRKTSPQKEVEHEDKLKQSHYSCDSIVSLNFSLNLYCFVQSSPPFLGVSIAAMSHLIPSRTQKLSSPAAILVPGKPGAKLARCPHFFSFFLVFSFSPKTIFKNNSFNFCDPPPPALWPAPIFFQNLKIGPYSKRLPNKVSQRRDI
jgi:hypothetical protein